MSACVKCGNPGNGNVWQTHAGGFGSNPAVKRRYCFLDTNCRVYPKSPPNEHLDITCGACGYTWAEPCKDAKP